MVGMLNSASVSELCAIPPVRLANHSAVWLAIGMNVGLGRSGSCSVFSQNDPNGPLWGRRAIALSSVCITRMMIVRRDQCLGNITCASRLGCRSTCSEELQRARHARAVADQQGVEAVHRVAGVAVGDGLDVGVGVGVDRGGDRHAFDQIVGVVLGHGHREDRLGVGAHELAQARGDARQRAVHAAALQQLVRAQRARRPRPHRRARCTRRSLRSHAPERSDSTS